MKKINNIKIITKDKKNNAYSSIYKRLTGLLIKQVLPGHFGGDEKGATIARPGIPQIINTRNKIKLNAVITTLGLLLFISLLLTACRNLYNQTSTTHNKTITIKTYIKSIAWKNVVKQDKQVKPRGILSSDISNIN